MGVANKDLKKTIAFLRYHCIIIIISKSNERSISYSKIWRNRKKERKRERKKKMENIPNKTGFTLRLVVIIFKITEKEPNINSTDIKDKHTSMYFLAEIDSCFSIFFKRNAGFPLNRVLDIVILF